MSLMWKKNSIIGKSDRKGRPDDARSRDWSSRIVVPRGNIVLLFADVILGRHKRERFFVQDPKPFGGGARPPPRV